MPIRTRRLRLRRLRPGDAPAVAALMDDWDVVKQTGGIPFPYSDAAARDWIALEARDWTRGIGCSLALERPDGAYPKSAHPDEDAFIGALSLRLAPRHLFGRTVELGYWLGQPYWGQGLASEAIGAALPWFCALSGARRVEAVTFADNAASIGVLTKLGFRLVRIATRTYPSRGGKRRIHIYRWIAPRAARSSAC